MIRCTKCLLPDTKPDLVFTDGVCAACINYANRPEVDWDQRLIALKDILKDAKPNAQGYNCVVPSSGGKDSHYQVKTLIDLGAKPLVVTASTDLLTPIGRANIDNLSRYATTIEVTPNRSVRSKLCRLGLELVGDISWPEHASIFSLPFKVAHKQGIELLFYGENPQREYGGPIGSETALAMNARWVSEFGGFLGLRPDDFVGHMGLTEADMADYQPSLTAMEKTSALFLGQFIPWDSHRNSRVAVEMGMQAKHPTPANWWQAENLDNVCTGIHDHLMYRKYGYGRGAAQMSVDIRSGREQRPMMLRLASKFDGLFPWTYAGVNIADLVKFIGMEWQPFLDVIDQHTNQDLFDGQLAERPLLKEFKEAA